MAELAFFVMLFGTCHVDGDPLTGPAHGFINPEVDYGATLNWAADHLALMKVEFEISLRHPDEAESAVMEKVFDGSYQNITS